MSIGLAVGLIVGLSILFFIIGGVVAFFVTRRLFQKQLKENPPINEKMIRAMFLQMGVKASESRIRQVMRSMQQAK
ncbi:conserved hypothetical protein [Mycoplasmopsis pulmonis]|uniref:UPF0154 protein MYPU_1460 n=1 Tax=Mycoplasmopsis pulmonis (strain UAB CTIP) TaxID=272635 RepID=Y146_MYCPU|nr:YneF family protein [Mycoplasmopsis pulmonis]Q98R64.1 RecName: Full=UPF0154 protein MYPU_1460 [Mycoplasmopsis pulmonis UAB CTIP]MDZ7293115.1 YneF family protein [Mycoplasmopsis pulmonis]CAC13319.1 conserved hypothetical protein [Mycoplasmopsis pulmonis]VEU67911.1 Uncharacterised protein family (UPF0154) [Mycoplasmopsis pulmonis]